MVVVAVKVENGSVSARFIVDVACVTTQANMLSQVLSVIFASLRAWNPWKKRFVVSFCCYNAAVSKLPSVFLVMI